MDGRGDDHVPMNDDDFMISTPAAMEALANAGSYVGEDAMQVQDSYETNDPSPQGYDVQEEYQQQQQQQPVNNPASYIYNKRPPLQGNQQPYPPAQQPYSPHRQPPYNRPPQQQHVNQPYPPQVNLQYNITNSPRQPPVNQPYPPPSPQQQQQQVNQYPPITSPVAPYSPWGQAVTWSTDLFACLDDINLCLLTNFAPCIAFGWIAEIVDEGTTSYATSARRYALAMAVPGTQFIYSGAYRTRMRQKYGIPGDGIEDVCTHIWCEGCALYQEYKELTARGYDVPLGWQGNLAKQKQHQSGVGVQMAPLSPNGMLR